MTRADGDVDFLYLDAEYFVEFMVEATREVQGSEVTVSTVLGDYKEVDGLLLDHSMEMAFGGGEAHFEAVPDTQQFPGKPFQRELVGILDVPRSALANVLDFGRRPQVQERLTQQILVALQALLGTEDVAVSIDATHYCVKSRGVMDGNSQTSTTALGGCFIDNIHTRAEFLNP